MDRRFWVYILASQRNGTLYMGVTGNVGKRIYEHREGLRPGFTADYGVKRLVSCAEYPTALEAITAEKRMKRWRRAWKIELIERANPQWLDLYPHLFG